MAEVMSTFSRRTAFCISAKACVAAVFRVRMVACKSTAKERWRQVLHEATRIPEKYLLTVDPSLTGSTIEAMLRAGVVPFLPSPVIHRSYAGHPYATSMASVADLVARLHAVTRESRADA